MTEQTVAGLAAVAGAMFTLLSVFVSLYLGRRNLASNESERLIHVLTQERDIYRQRWEDCTAGRATVPVERIEVSPVPYLTPRTAGLAVGTGLLSGGIIEALLHALKNGLPR